MRVRVSVALLALALSAAAGGGRAWATSPKAGLTKGEAIRAFVDAANLVCIFTTVSHRSIEEAAGHADDDLVLADADDRKFSVAPKDHPMWVSKTAGNLVHMSSCGRWMAISSPSTWREPSRACRGTRCASASLCCR
jgi:hypothetical protein